MKWFLGACLLALVSSVVTLGFGRTSTLIRSVLGRAEKTVENNLSDDDVQGICQVKLKDLDRQIRAHHVAIGKLEDRHGTVESVIGEKERRLEAEKLLLQRARELLVEGRATYEIAGKKVMRGQLSSDAELRLVSCGELQKQIALQRKLGQQLKQSIDEGRANLVQAQRLQQEMLAELEGTRARLATAKERQSINELCAALRELPGLAPDSELGRALQQLRDRARDAERLADLLVSEAKVGGLINWEERQDVTEEIRQFLEKGDHKNGK